MKDTQKTRHSLTLTLTPAALLRFQLLARHECRSFSSLIIFLLTREADSLLPLYKEAPGEESNNIDDEDENEDENEDEIEEDDGHPHPLLGFGDSAAEDFAALQQSKSKRAPKAKKAKVKK
jgi:hypothetical protein